MDSHVPHTTASGSRVEFGEHHGQRRLQRIRRHRLMVAGIFAAVLLIGFIVALLRNPLPERQLSVTRTDKIIAQLLHKKGDHPPAHLLNSAAPAPTNKWFSGLVFAQPSTPVYAYPWSYKTTGSGAELSATQPQSKANAITAPHQPDISVDLGAQSAAVASYDQLSAKVAHQAGGKTIATSRITEGSPYVFFSLRPHQHARITLQSGAVLPRDDHSYWLQSATQHYGIRFDGLKANGQDGALTLQAGDNTGRFALLLAPGNQNDDRFFAAGAHPIDHTAVNYQLHRGKLRTTLSLATSDHHSTIYGLLPDQVTDQTTQPLATTQTLEGVQRSYQGNSFSYELSSDVPSQTILQNSLNKSDRQKLIDQLKRDANDLKFTQTDSYNAGQELYRAANLYELAKELGQKGIAAKIEPALSARLGQWLDPLGSKSRSDRYFYYDSGLGGVVGVRPAGGAERFDNHLQYGYFIYAASVLAKYDPSFVHAHGDMVDVLAEDIASPSASKYFPQLRNFDAYAGHSWSSGYGTSDAGNNQQTSAEAVNAWFALYNWAKVSNNQQLELESNLLYQHETAAALRNNINFEPSSSLYKNYRHSIVPLVWGGKLEYASFLGATPEAKLGSQLMPMSPGQEYLASDKARIDANLRQMNKEGVKTAQFKDYLLMYQALSEPKAARAKLANFKASELDRANSLSYLEAFVDSRQ